MSAGIAAPAVLPMAGAAVIGVAGIAVIGAAVAGGVAIYLTANGIMAAGEGVQRGVQDALRDQGGRAAANASTLRSREFALAPVVADHLLRGAAQDGRWWESRQLRLSLADGTSLDLAGAMFDTTGRFLFGLARRGRSLVAVTQGKDGEDALNDAYRGTILDLGDRKMREQGFQCIDVGANERGDRVRVYSRPAAGGRLERYEFVEDRRTGNITVNVLTVTSSGEVKFGDACPTPNGVLESLLPAGVRAQTVSYQPARISRRPSRPPDGRGGAGAQVPGAAAAARSTQVRRYGAR